ncbi:MAG: hypothetical protein G3M78_02550 [Candidatus Nitrohelix vancouverensis]|uniref:Uncharacterized protein n=1 Tax=Candidatus Nitrohelix vancouverensis TaxID=2705534 RepID=A0A7T0G2H0_9BACT|nr:MAG: hypothetical protein G3M78_02550 [Candidatus Nitrohelix vancouverensis]
MKSNIHPHIMSLLIFTGLIFLMSGAVTSADAEEILKVKTSMRSLELVDSDTHRQAEDSILLTVFLKHDQSKTIDEIQTILSDAKFMEQFPPAGTHVVSWYVMMGIGQVVTLEVPAKKLREVNLAVERSGWKAFRTEFYATYNLYPVIKSKLANQSQKCLRE